MGHQTKVNESNGSSKAASKGLARDVGEFAHDVFILAELQFQLFIADMQECRQRAIVPGLVLLGGATLGLACFPIALTALALWLIQVFELSNATGFLLAVAVGALLSALLCSIGWYQVRARVAVLKRSKQEFVHNVRWIRQLLTRSRTARKSSEATCEGSEHE